MRGIIVLGLAVMLSFASCGKKSDIEKLVVASEQANCMGVVPQKCFLIKKDGVGDWEYWYSGIKGLDYERGYEYVIKVRKEKLENAPADHSSFIYVLDKVVSKKQKESDNLPPSVKTEK